MSNLTERLREGAHALLDKAGDWQERIRQRAQAIWEREGRPEGRHEEHWSEAEKELAAEDAAAAGKKKSTGSRQPKAKAGTATARTVSTRKNASARKASAPVDAAIVKEVTEGAEAGKGMPSTKSPRTPAAKLRRRPRAKDPA